MPIQKFAVPSCAGHRSPLFTQYGPRLSREQLVVERLSLSKSSAVTLTDPISEGDDPADPSIIEKWMF
jgi:hypothetical protein